jgi:hypothetical protein
VPGECFVPFSSVQADGFRALGAGPQVELTYEETGGFLQDGCRFRALAVWPLPAGTDRLAAGSADVRRCDGFCPERLGIRVDERGVTHIVASRLGGRRLLDADVDLPLGIRHDDDSAG